MAHGPSHRRATCRRMSATVDSGLSLAVVGGLSAVHRWIILQVMRSRRSECLGKRLEHVVIYQQK